MKCPMGLKICILKQVKKLLKFSVVYGQLRVTIQISKFGNNTLPTVF